MIDNDPIVDLGAYASGGRSFLSTLSTGEIMKPMKILIAYDASDCSRDMLVDLAQAGLPADVHADIVSFAEVWLSDPELVVAHQSPTLDTDGGYVKSHSREAYREAIAVAREGREKVGRLFPTWYVTCEAHANTATSGTLETVRNWQPDLVVVGSHRRSALGRILHGSVGQRLLAESPCSVRIARAPYGRQQAGLRILLAVDGSAASDAAVKTVIARTWPSGSSVRVVSVREPNAVDSSVGVVIGPETIGFARYDIDSAEESVADARAMIEFSGLPARSIVAAGRPAHEILHEAERWGADMIFMGARGHGFVERILIGSVSNVVALRAHCSVEIVRLHP